MTGVRVRCLTCARVSFVDADELGTASCRLCGSKGLRRDAPTFVPSEPTRIGPHEAPADELDEADDVERRRAWRAAVQQADKTTDGEKP